MESSLLNRCCGTFCCGIFAAGSLLWNPLLRNLRCWICGLGSKVVESLVVEPFVVESSLWNPLLRNLCCGVFVVLLLWNLLL